MYLNPQWLRLLSMQRLWFSCCWFIVLCTSTCLWVFWVVHCFVMHYFVSFPALQLSWWGREPLLLCFNQLPDVFRLLVFSGSSLRCHGLVSTVWLWYMHFLTILTYFFIVFATMKISILKCNCVYAADLKSRRHYQNKNNGGIRVKWLWYQAILNY